MKGQLLADWRTADLLANQDAVRIRSPELGDGLAVFHRDLDACLGGWDGGGGTSAAISRLFRIWGGGHGLHSAYCGFCCEHSTREKPSLSMRNCRWGTCEIHAFGALASCPQLLIAITVVPRRWRIVTKAGYPGVLAETPPLSTPLRGEFQISCAVGQRLDLRAYDGGLDKLGRDGINKTLQSKLTSRRTGRPPAATRSQVWALRSLSESLSCTAGACG
jgi:hypothetical protein